MQEEQSRIVLPVYSTRFLNNAFMKIINSIKHFKSNKKLNILIFTK